MGRDCYKSLPQPEYLQFTAASVSDLSAVKPLLPRLKDRRIIADKIYASAPP